MEGGKLRLAALFLCNRGVPHGAADRQYPSVFSGR